MTIVWVVEQGCYESRSVIGVYATAEAAMADCPSRPGGWKQYEYDGSWTNGLDWDYRVSIEPFELKGPGEQETP